MSILKRIPFIMGTLVISIIQAQKKEIKFGEVSREEMKMTTYDKDTLADAVVLFDKGASSFYDVDKDYNIKFLRHKRIKVFDKTATKHLEVAIPYFVDGYGKTELIRSIRAITYTLDNNNQYSETKLDPDHIYDEQINDRWYLKKFIFPNVQDGSVLEYEYEFETPFHYNLPDWNFQDKIPTIYSEYSVRMIPFYEYVMRAQGIIKFDYQNSKVSNFERSFGNNGRYKDYIHTYILKDIPAFKDESYITSVNDYIIKMDFQLSKIHYPYGGSQEIISTWPNLNKELLHHDHFGKYIKKSKRYAKELLEENFNITPLNKQDLAEQIITYIKSNYAWNGHNSKYTSQSAKDFIETREGNSADINLFLIAMLNQAGIKAEPIVLSTRSHGKIPISYPFDNSSNYVIVLAHTDYPFLTDATEPLLPYNLIPFKSMNEKGLLVNQDKTPSWIDLSNKVSSLEKKFIMLNLDPETLNVDAKINIQYTIYKSYIYRKKFKDDNTKIKEYYSDFIGEIQDVKTYNYEQIKNPYAVNLISQYSPEILENKIILKPFFKLPLSKNYLTQQDRNYPVDFEYLSNSQYECLLTIPENYSLNYLPKSYHANDDLVDIHINFSLKDNLLKITGNYSFKKSIYVPSEYTRIKTYLDKIVKYFNQPVLLEKQ
ncbi:DUF3857 domain-containing protein [Wenyingzhuangia sp. 1_MG-2023]|nr:DUF3857 domain-containing protein [Wenyingzhuangia sp. 1_MG-2023]